VARAERINPLVVCIDARHAHAALSVGINKSDPNDTRPGRTHAHGLVSRGKGEERGEPAYSLRSCGPYPPAGVRREIESQVRARTGRRRVRGATRLTYGAVEQLGPLLPGVETRQVVKLNCELVCRELMGS
jgi:hypothetical protein